MGELLWIGNTLCSRWVVFAAIAISIAIFAAITTALTSQPWGSENGS